MSTLSSAVQSSLVHPKAPFQLLEVNVISAQDLAMVSRNMKTYAIAWVNPGRKLSTRVDSKNGSNPSWNDKFVFRVDESFLRSDTAAVMIEIYAVKWFRDVRVGSVRVLVGNLLPPATRTQNSGMRFIALQVRRPSGRPQGIINIGVALLDGSMRSMPLYTQLSTSAVGFRDLMGEEQQNPDHHPHILRRTRSERPSNVTADDLQRRSGFTYPIPEDGEPPIITITTTGSMWSESDVGPTPSTMAAGVTAHDLFSLPEVGGDDWRPEKSKGEDLKSKLERWKTELPAKPIPGARDNERGLRRSKTSATGHRRRHTDGGAGLFSCFGDVNGFECAVSCGVKPRKGRRREDVVSDSDDTMPFPKFK